MHLTILCIWYYANKLKIANRYIKYRIISVMVLTQRAHNLDREHPTNHITIDPCCKCGLTRKHSTNHITIDHCHRCGMTSFLQNTKKLSSKTIDIKLFCARFWTYIYLIYSLLCLWDVNFIFLISYRECNWIMKQFFHGNKANEINVIPLFMEDCEKLHYISLTIRAISRTQFSRIQAYHTQ